MMEEWKELEGEWNYDGEIARAIRDEALERAAKIADEYRSIESRAIAEDIRSLKHGKS